MKPQVKQYLLALVFLLSITGCGIENVNGRGAVIEEIRGIDSFSSISLDIPAKVYIQNNSEPSLRIRTHENLLRRIETTVVGNELQIESVSNIRDADVLDIYVSSAALANFRITGAGIIYLEDCLNENSASFEITGAGLIYACGVTEELSVSIAGAGKYEGFDLEAQTAQLSISGAGVIETTVSDQIQAKISGAGNIEYYGNPQVSSQINGAGVIRKRN